MDIRDLRCFKAVFEHKSMNRAAKILFITPQGLGKIITNLEKELETTLFERSAKGLKPTESAEMLYAQADRLVQRFEVMEHAIKQLHRKEKNLTIYCARGILNALSFRVVSSFMDQYPEVEVIWKEMSNQAVKEAVGDHQADVGLVVGRTKKNEIAEDLLQTKKICVLAYQGHPYYDRQEVSIEELDGEKVVTLNEQYQVYHDFMTACKRTGVTPVMTGLTEDSHFLYKLCRQKIGLGIALDFSVEDFKMEDIRMIPLQEQLTWDIYLIYAKECQHYSNIKLFADYVRKLYC